MERFVIIVNGFQPLTIISKRSILDVAAALDSHLTVQFFRLEKYVWCNFFILYIVIKVMENFEKLPKMLGQSFRFVLILMKLLALK